MTGVRVELSDPKAKCRFFMNANCKDKFNELGEGDHNFAKTEWNDEISAVICKVW
ncbi:hypothetical protein IAQ61_004927, partial [Plenodomus lingam]|uniref:Predicted protein n=1 Tax=Leptosphaeria maculans (strain JN3 / isolate v23.1.3 / race Av1-4-5-6-7-8) TaxID=985895 RepID=E4ZWX3_LEPMJ